MEIFRPEWSRGPVAFGPCTMRPVRRQDFSYDLPEELIAQSPLAERSASRLLVLDGATGGVADRVMGDLPGYLRERDLLVFNDTRVVAARVVGAKPSGGRVEIFLERVLGGSGGPSGAGVGERAQSHELAGAGEGQGREAHGLEARGREALVQLRASKPIREGLEVTTPGGVVRVLGREEELWRVETPGDALEFFEAWGEVPLPPYIHRPADESDRERYQSIFAREKGAVAAPTASLHFDAPLLAKLEAMGVGRAFVTLHVGAGTFQPLRTDDLDAHRMHAERVSVSRATWDAVNRTRAAGGRVVAVGTTVVRALESAALEVGDIGACAESSGEDIGATPVWSGETRLFIRPGFEFKAIDAMVTNFHLPESTLLMLVSAFAGTENVLGAYAHAVGERYRFFSYGDAMFVTPQKPRKTATGTTTP
jgi:S-adenosylmethionine:tRNA ribosyltransferase-isomerase